jgi:CheY-like chemotaxis protein
MTEPNASMKTPRILIVNQDHVLRSLDEDELRHAGYRTQCTASGRQALAMLAKGGFDLVLTDRNLQGLDGFDLVRAIRAAGNRIPVMIVSVWIAADGGLPADVRDEVAATLPRPASRSALRAGVARALRWLPTAPRRSRIADASTAIVTTATQDAHRCGLHQSQPPLLNEHFERTAMNSPRTALRAFISAKLAIVLAVIAVGGGLLAYEWHHADSAKTHHTGAHHHHQRDAHGVAPN